MDSARNLLSNVPENLAEELAETLQAGAGLRIERIISLGHASPAGFWYDQDENEWVLLVSGAARLRFEGEEPMELKPGSYVDIPAHRRHRASGQTRGSHRSGWPFIISDRQRVRHTATTEDSLNRIDGPGSTGSSTTGQ